MRRAFTAFELVVVLVIIAVLALMLIPALEEGHRGAKRATCLNRVRQVGMAFEMYHSSHGGSWPSVRRSVLPEWPDSPDPTGSLAVLYPEYASKPYLFQCPATEDIVILGELGLDFRDCENFYVSPDGKPMREEDAGKGVPRPPSYFYDGGHTYGGIPRHSPSGRVVYGDQCVHGYLGDEEGHGTWIGSDNHTQAGGNFLFVDKHVEWLEVQWTGEPWRKGKSLPYVANPHTMLRRPGTGDGEDDRIPDTNVFWSYGGAHGREWDADLAGMMWMGESWLEF